MESTKFYILVGEKETWVIALLYNMWGFTERTKGNWNTSNIGDYVGSYVTSPAKRIIRFGTIKEKFVDENIIWPDEELFNRSIWKYRIKFNIYYVIDDWEKGIRIPSYIMLKTGRKMINKQTFLHLLMLANTTWKTKICNDIFKR